MTSPIPTNLDGVVSRALTTHRDERGWLSEIFRLEWPTGLAPVQWNAVQSAAGVLRGVHVHVHHTDYIAILQGRASFGLHDLRPASPTRGRAALVEMSSERPATLTIPPGVAHGFYFHEPTLLVYGVTAYWRTDDEMGCHWADPDLGIPWPTSHPALSPRDAAAGRLSDLAETYRRRAGADGRP